MLIPERSMKEREQETGGRPTRRHFLELGGAAAAAWDASPLSAADPAADPRLRAAIAQL
jgi:hypothetical protein